MKKLFYLITFLIQVSFITQSTSCIKTEEPQTHCDIQNTAYIPTDAKSRFYFKDGTWWVYKNVNNNEFDTIIVKSLYNTIEPTWTQRYGTKYKNKCYERVAYRITSNKYGWHDVDIDFINPYQQQDSTIEQYFITESSSDIENFVTYRWEYRGGLLIDSLSSGLKERLKIITINNKTYSDIIYYKYKPGFEAGDYLNEAWYANRVGLIKVVRKDGTIWEIVQSNIIQ